MKKVLYVAFMLITLVAVLTFTVSAEVQTGSCGTNATYEFDTETGKLTISGSGTLSANWSAFAADVKSIEVKGGISNIPKGTFATCTNVEELTLPFIGISATSYTYNATVGAIFGYTVSEPYGAMSEIELVHGVQYVDSFEQFVGGGNGDATITYYQAYTYKIPKTLRKVNLTGGIARGFVRSGVEELVIGSAVTKIEQLPETLEAITIEDTVYINNDVFVDTVFYNDSSNWTDGALYVDGCFIEASGTMPEYIVADGTTTIADSAFSGLTAIEKVYIPDSVISIANNAFSGCTTLKEIRTSMAGSYIPKTVEKVTVAAGRLGNNAFKDYTNLREVELLDGVNAIGSYAFSGCTLLELIYIPSSVTAIGVDVFNSAVTICGTEGSVAYYHAEEYGIPFVTCIHEYGEWTSVNGVDLRTCAKCSETQNKIQSGVCGDEAEWSLDLAMGHLYLSGVGEVYDYDTISAPWSIYAKYIKSVDVSDGITVLGDDALKNCSLIKSIQIASTVKRIGEGALSDCPDAVISGNIGDYSEEYALRNNFVFEALDVADMIGVCGDAAWYWYESFGKLVISGEGNVKYDSNWTSIAEKVKSIEVKDSITSINCGAFEKFVNLEEIRIPFVGKSRTAENHEAVFGYIFNYVVLPYAGGRPTPLAYADYICQYYKLYYDDGEIYDQDEYYYHIPKKINKVIFTGTTIPYRAFMKCSMIKDIVLTNVESIDKEAFYGYKITAHAPKGSAIETYAKSNTNITFEPFCSSSSGHECVVTSTIASTCTTEGYSVYSCLHCDYSYNDDYQPLIDHSYVKTETAPTCTAAGVIKYTCEVCGKNYTETGATATGHSYGEWKPVEGLNESERICSVCGNTVKVVSSGTHGTNITWFIDYNTGVLYISGEGEIGAVSSTTYAPWYTYRNAYSEVVVGEGITDIGAYVFQNHANIKKITFPSTLTSIASYAFHNCTGLEAVCVTDLETWLSYSFAGYVHTPLYYAGNLYCNGELVENIVIPDSFTKIGKYAFTGCTSIKSVVMHDNITEMGDYAFYGCTSLEEVTFSKKMTTVSIRGFMNCASLKDIVFPESVTTIKHHAFTGCSGLENVVMPKTITSIGTDAFAECSTFTVYGEKGSKAQSFASSSSLIFKDISEYNASSESKEYSGFCGENITWVFDSEGKLTLAGSGEVPDYAAATDVPWAEYISLINSIVIGEGITSIGSNIFMNCTVLEEITISSTVTSIGENAFDGCTALKKVHITDFESWCNISFSNIQSNPVMYAKSFYIKGEHITEAELPATITEIKAYVFRYSNLEKITVWGEIANVGSSAFEYCESLTIYGYEGTALETYAIDSSIPFVAIRCEEHTFSEWITTTEPTETTEGEKTRKCTVCKFIETETLPVVLPEVKGKATYTLSGIEAMPGETVSLTLSLKTNTEVNSIALSEFEYDSDVLEFIGFTDTEAIEELCALTPIFDDENEYILIALSEDMIFDGTICTLNFKIKENIEDTVASISANTVAKLNSIVLESTLESAGITVYNYVIGDIDGDRDADLDDAVYLFGYSMLPNLYPVSYPGTMDFNKDGNIDLQDAMMLFRYSMLPDLYPLE